MILRNAFAYDPRVSAWAAQTARDNLDRWIAETIDAKTKEGLKLVSKEITHNDHAVSFAEYRGLPAAHIGGIGAELRFE